MDDLNDLIWTTTTPNSKPTTNTTPPPLPRYPSSSSLPTTPPLSAPHSRLGSGTASPLGYRVGGGGGGSSTTPHYQPPPVSSNKLNSTSLYDNNNNKSSSKEVDPFASLVTFNKPTVQKKSLHEQELERRKATEVGSSTMNQSGLGAGTIPERWQTNPTFPPPSNFNRPSPTSTIPRPTQSPSPVVTRPTQSPSSLPNWSSPTHSTSSSQLNSKNSTTHHLQNNHNQAVDIFDIAHLSQTNLTPPSSKLTPPPEDDDDGLLGLLGKPVEEVKRLQGSSPEPNDLDSKLAQLVARGHEFDVAKTALSLTEGGDVESAHQIITQHLQAENQADRSHSPGSSDDESYQLDHHQARRRDAYLSSESPSRDSPTPRFNKEQLLAQAEEVGNSVFSAATTMFSRSKHLLKNTWEELQNRSSSGSNTPTHRFDYSDQSYSGSPRQSYIDSEGSEDEEATPPPPKPTRQKPVSATITTPRSPAVEPVHVTPTPPVLPQDHVVASSQQLAQSEQLKRSGNDKFRIGQYTEAETFYTQAIDALPSQHSALIPILTNRASTREKIGHFRDSLSDAEQALQLIGDDKLYLPTPGAQPHDGKAGLPLKELYAKALLRKAVAYEGLENHSDAMRTYETLTTLPTFHARALEGARRCRQIMRGPPPRATDRPSTPPSKPVVRQPPPPIVSSDEISRNTAVQALREKEALQAEEEAQRFAASDDVDLQLTTWRKGREGNLRALLASLDTILWSDLNWKPVALPQLIDPSAVKRHYLRAIAKLHPDKLAAATTSVTHRLLAGHVFATLNLAWDQFRTDQLGA